jgi:hypothetical protein
MRLEVQLQPELQRSRVGGAIDASEGTGREIAVGAVPLHVVERVECLKAELEAAAARLTEDEGLVERAVLFLFMVS